MLVYGWNSKVIKEGEAKNMQCNACEHEGQLVGVTGSYAHLFWIPFFPYKKSVVVVCPNCGQTTEAKSLPEDLKRQVKAVKESAPFPKYMFSGLMIAAVIAVIATISGIQSDSALKEAVSDPALGDVYNVKDTEETSEYKYSFWKVSNIHNDSVDLYVSEMSYNMESDEMLDGDSFIKFPMTIHKDELVKRYEDGSIKELFRNYEGSTGFYNETEPSQEFFQQIFSELGVDDIELSVESDSNVVYE